MKKLLIKGGLLYTGDCKDKASFQNILIDESGKILEISDQEIAIDRGDKVIDATGKWVMPGFVDSHTHYDAELIASPGLKESARHGVTTIVLGSCSVSAIYNDAEDTSDSFTRVEAIPREIMLPLMEKEKTWNTPGEWKDYINQLPLGINVASFVGHSDLRMKVMGVERAVKDNEVATSAEQTEMNRMLEEALDEGFLGLSTMDNPWDKMDGEKYWSHKTPSFYASWKERSPLIKLLRKRGAILQGAPNLITRISSLRYMAASTGLFRKPLKTTMIAMIDLIADRYLYWIVAFGVKVFNRLLKGNFRMQSPPCPFTVYYDGVDSVMFEEFPAGEAMRHLAKKLDERNIMLSDEEFRKRFKQEIRKKFAPKVWHRDLSIAYILDCPDPSLIGKNFYEIAKEQGKHPVDTFLDLIIEYDKQIRWTTTIGNDRPENYRHLYNYPFNLISFSDAGAHLNNMAFYNFPLKMIKNVYQSIKAQNPIMTLEKCVWRLTKEQADWFGLDCGHIAEGKIADIAIVNPCCFDQITEEVAEAPIEEFDDYPRLVNRNEKVIANVIVGGKVIYAHEEFVEGYGKTEKFGSFLPYQNSRMKSELVDDLVRTAGA